MYIYIVNERSNYFPEYGFGQNLESPANMGDRAGQQGSQGRTSRLYPSLSFLEISVYTATWICGVMFALYSLYRASMEQVSPCLMCF